MLHSR